MKIDQQCGKATSVTDTEASPPNVTPTTPVVPLPLIQMIPACGIVDGNRYVSNFALNHFVEIVIATAWQVLMPPESNSIAQCLLSVAIGPSGTKRLEIDFLPRDTAFEQRELLIKLISEIEVPYVEGGPVAFGIVVSLKHVAEHSLTFFPTLAEAIKLHGVEKAIGQAIGCNTERKISPSLPNTEGNPMSWWRRILLRTKSGTVGNHSRPTAREIENSQQYWLAGCEEIANQLSWIEIKRAILSTPDDLRYTVALAEKHRHQENWSAALDWYDSAVRQLKYCAALIGRRAELHLQNGNTQEALRDSSLAIEYAPQIASYRVARALVYCQLPAWEEAVKDLDEALRLESNQPDALYHRAQVRMRQNQYHDAMKDLREALRLDPNFGSAHFYLGWCYTYYDSDKLDEAIRHFTCAIVLTNDAGDIRLNRSLAYLSQRKYALALEDCDQVLSSFPDNAEAHCLRGRILQGEGEFAEAIVACTQAIEMGHEHAAVYLARAISYASTDQPALAASDCEMALSMEPDNALAIQLSGRLKLQIGDLDSAMDAFNRARELAPDWTEPGQFMALVHQMKETLKPLLRSKQSLLRSTRSNPHFMLIGLLPTHK